MAIAREQGRRPVRESFVQQFLRLCSWWRPESIAAPNPILTWMSFCVLCGGFLHLLNRSEFAELQTYKAVAAPQKVRMIIDNSGHSHLSVQINQLGRSTLVFCQIVAAANSDYLVPANCNRFSPRRLGIRRIDVSVDEQGFFRCNRCFTLLGSKR